MAPYSVTSEHWDWDSEEEICLPDEENNSCSGVDNTLSKSQQNTGLENVPFRFLDLPAEIRVQIYHYALIARSKRYTFPPPEPEQWYLEEPGIKDRVKSLLLVNRQIYNETVSILYEKNVFQLRPNAISYKQAKKTLQQERFSRIRRVQLVFQTIGCSYAEELDSSFWTPLLSKITHLYIVAQQPVDRRSRPDGSTEERFWEMNRWVRWISCVFKYIAECIPEESDVQIDYDNRKETSTVVEKFFGSRPYGYRTGKFSWVSGDWEDT